MKRILILGAANDQVPLIIKSKELGYYVIACDRTADNPGIQYVDKHYQVDYMDRDRVYEIAVNEHIDGVISNSEIVMQHVAYISEKLGLRGNTVESIKQLGEKNLFRKLQKRANVYTPKQADVKSAVEAIDAVKKMSLPVLIKPCRNSASRGIVKIDSLDDDVITEAFNICIKDSWNNEASVEEFVEMPSLKVIEGDIFIYDGKILWDGLFNNLRSQSAPMVPMTDVSPLSLTEEQKRNMQETVSRIIREANIKFGAFNIEMYFTNSNQLFVIEINTRQGGVGVPKYIEQYSGIDFSKLLVSLCVEDYSYCNDLENHRFTVFKNRIRHVVFSKENGVFDSLHISDEIKPYIINIEMCVSKGDCVFACENGTDAVARIDLDFASSDRQWYYASQLENFVFPVFS